MELRHLRYFTAVMEAKGYRNAARRFNIAQPALSQAVADLEAEMNVKLFARHGSQVQPTPAGEVFYQECKRTLEQVESAIAATKRADKRQTGLLRIGFIPSATQHFLPKLLETFKAQHPEIELHVRDLTPTKQIEALSEAGLDLAFTRKVGDDHAEYQSRFLFQVPLIAVLPASRAVSNGQIDIRNLAEDRLILLDRAESPPLFDSITGLCRNAGFSPRIDSRAYLAESMFMLVKAGEGVAIVPSWAKAFLTEGLQIAKLMPSVVAIELALLWKRGAESRAIQAFVELLDQELPKIQAITAREFGITSRAVIGSH